MMTMVTFWHREHKSLLGDHGPKLSTPIPPLVHVVLV
jgi:hypothetical protein